MANLTVMKWLNIDTAPINGDLQVTVIEANGEVHPVIFPCRRIFVEIHPTHWQEWETRGKAAVSIG